MYRLLIGSACKAEEVEVILTYRSENDEMFAE